MPTTDRVECTKAALIVNTGSRTGAAAFNRARERLTALGLPLVDVFPLSDATRLPETVQRALADGCDLVVLGGGDGTVSAVVDQLVAGAAVLGVLPLGTANDFARTMGIPSDVDAACEVLSSGKVVDVDLGVADDNYFVNVASLGLSVAVSRALSPSLKRRLGAVAYPIATLKAYRGYEPFRARLEFPQGDHATIDIAEAMQVAIGNGRYYGGGNVMAPGAGIDDHSLDVYAIARGRFRDHLKIVSAFRTGRFVEHELVTHVATREVVVRTDPPRHINIDGEVVTATPEVFRVVRNGLHVAVPQESTAAQLDTPQP
ncbi:MAG: lipid kinase [Actinomycetota bacterium]|nr:lipid kinase [Actinomycetota bacterium]